jgi:hypothetical protein
MTFLNELFEQVTSTPEEYDCLYNSDNLYIAWAKSKDDKKLDDFVNAIDPEWFFWRAALKGETRRKSKLERPEVTGPLQGYIFNVTKEQMDLFEKVALMPSMKYGYRFEKYDVSDLKKQEKEEMLAALTREDE